MPTSPSHLERSLGSIDTGQEPGGLVTIQKPLITPSTGDQD